MMRQIFLMGLVPAAVMMLAAPAAATPPTEPDPSAVLRSMLANRNLQTQGTGEFYAWHAANDAQIFLDAYEAYGNTQWLDAAIRYYAAYLAKLQKDPDGFEGWIGDPEHVAGVALSKDALIGDAILCEPLIRFAWIVLVREPDLKPRYGQTAQRYVDLVTRIIWDKWNHRGCYYEDASGFGSYHTHGKLIDLENNRWVDAPSRVISDNLNKHYTTGIVLLRLWQITGQEAYRQRVEAIFSRAKTLWRYFPEEDRVVFNFWMPHGPHDMAGQAPRSWVGVHPNRAGYQAGEVADFVKVYDAGLVFDRDDIARLIRTNHWMMPDAQRPGWRSADGSSDAGTLWTALARFDPRIRQAYEQRLAGRDTPANRIRMAYLLHVTDPRGGFARLWHPADQPARVANIPPQPGRHLTMAMVIPDTLELANDDRVQLACQVRAPGTLTIELLDAADQTVLGTLAQIDTGDGGESGAFHAPHFDGTHPATGQKQTGKYLVRWTLGNESRTAPLYVVQGQRRDQPGLASLEPGQVIEEDFEGELDERWKLDRAAVTDERAHGGQKSLRVDGEAELVFGRHDDLPVRISMWVFDDGHKRGQRHGNGPGWGVGLAAGDRFAIRQVWRTYLDGDNQYAWLNTAMGQWFNPHRTDVPRREGWSQWVFDLTDPDNPTIKGHESVVQHLQPRFTPRGAVSVFLLGGPLFIDDVRVEYPAR